MPQITQLTEDLAVADKDNGPRTTNDVKLINAGRILENSKTLGESRLPAIEVPGGVITMHVVVRPPVNDRNNDKLKDDSLKKGGCACTIL
uniref:NTGP5 n=1 Tax=Solanum tuberosum TaxID=4113 RepID=M1AG23_SOLTU